MLPLSWLRRWHTGLVCLGLLALLLPSGACALTPEARARHVAIYDPVNQRMLVWGGDNGSQGFYRDLWSLSLAPGVTPTWSKLGSIAGPPEQFRGAAAVYDSRRKCIYLYGGGNLSNTPSDRLVRLDLTKSPPVWDAPILAGEWPPALMYHSMAYDSIGDRVYLFGGLNGTTRNGDTYELVPFPGVMESFRLSIPPGPEPRYGHVSFFDSVHRRMFVMGGVGNPYETTITPTWALSVASDPPSWASVGSFGGPPNLRFASAMYNPLWERTRLIGGAFIYPWSSYANFQTDPWLYWILYGGEWPSGWSSDRINGTGPGNDVLQLTTVYDQNVNRLIRFGGATIPSGGLYTDTPTTVFNTTWQLTQPQWAPDDAWTQIATGLSANKKSAQNPGVDSQTDVRGSLLVSGGLGRTPVYFRLRAGSQPIAMRVVLVDVRGRMVRTLDARGGLEVVWDLSDRSGREAPAGVYFYRATIGGQSSSGRVVLTK